MLQNLLGLYSYLSVGGELKIIYKSVKPKSFFKKKGRRRLLTSFGLWKLCFNCAQNVFFSQSLIWLWRICFLIEKNSYTEHTFVAFYVGSFNLRTELFSFFPPLSCCIFLHQVVGGGKEGVKLLVSPWFKFFFHHSNVKERKRKKGFFWSFFSFFLFFTENSYHLID